MILVGGDCGLDQVVSVEAVRSAEVVAFTIFILISSVYGDGGDYVRHRWKKI